MRPLVLLLCLTAGCAGPTAGPDGPIRDLGVLPQDCTAYLDPVTADRSLVPADAQKAMAEQYRRKHYAPWRRDRVATEAKAVAAPFDRYTKDPGYGANGVKYPAGWAGGLRASAALRDFPNAARRAITVRPTDLREMPTRFPRFDDFHAVGKGYPFDTLQNTGLHVNTPVFVAHVSAGGEWAFVEAPYAAGWMPAADLAHVDDAFMATWEAGRLLAMVRDNVAISAGPNRLTANLGGVLPQGSGSSTVLAAVADADGKAVIREGAVGADSVAAMPLELTPRRIAGIANVMLGQPYCWGGLYGGRDCSATIRDLFTPFGLFLPRDSADQVKAGRFVPLKDLPGPEKERGIIDAGAPFTTLLRSPGHIMLYLGVRDGKAVMLHNFWGVKTRDARGREGRRNVGACVITSLRPGIELPDIDLPSGDYRWRIEGMTLLMENGALGPCEAERQAIHFP